MVDSLSSIWGSTPRGIVRAMRKSLMHVVLSLLASLGLLACAGSTIPAPSTVPAPDIAPAIETAEQTAPEPKVETRWYRVDIGGQRAGWMMQRETIGVRTVTTESDMQLDLRRGAAEIHLEMADRFVEALDGTPISAWSRQLLGPEPVETSYEFTPSTVIVTTRHGDRESRERQELPGETGWLTPRQSQRALEMALAAGQTDFLLSTVEPQLGMTPTDEHWVLQAPALEVSERPVDPTGQPVDVSRWHLSHSITPQVVTVVDLDAQGHVVRSSTPMMGLPMDLTWVSEAEAKADLEAPEILVQSFILLDEPILRPRHTRRAVYELWVDDGELGELPSGGLQTVEQSGNRARVEVDLGRATPVDPDVDPATYLRASTHIDHEDPKIHDLVELALADAGDDIAGRAETLRTYVHNYLDARDLGSVMATATEAAVSRSGDCTEHSVLLAALLRADGIPARVVSGLVYVDQFVGQRQLFGYHMWTQALIDDHWVDLDASMPTPFDATHIAFAATAFNDDKAAFLDLSRLAPLIGRAKLRVLEVE